MHVLFRAVVHEGIFNDEIDLGIKIRQHAIKIVFVDVYLLSLGKRALGFAIAEIAYAKELKRQLHFFLRAPCNKIQFYIYTRTRYLILK